MKISGAIGVVAVLEELQVRNHAPDIEQRNDVVAVERFLAECRDR